MDLLGIAFQLSGEVNSEGNIQLKKITSYYAHGVGIHLYEKYDVPDNPLSAIMESWNAKFQKI